MGWHLRFKPGLSDFFIYAASATVDGTVLRGHDGLQRSFAFHVTRKRRKLWNDYNDLDKNVHALDGLETLPLILALNFFPERAALTIRSTRAAAIWFFTGPDSFVLDMLEAGVRFL